MENEYKLGKFEPDDIVIDVGGHIGIFAIDCVQRGADVISFEPNPESYELMLKNVETNDWEHRIAVYKQAIATTEGKAILYLDDVNPGSHSLVKECVDHPGNNKIEVDTVTLDSVTKNFEVKLLKLDCEGSEYDIIKESNLDNVEEITGELHDVNKNQDLVDYLIKIGYFVKWVFGKRLGMFWGKR